MNLSSRLSSRCREVAGAAVYWSGAGRAFELAARPTGAVILMYHSIAAEGAAEFVDPRNRILPAMFERQMEFLSQHRRVVSLSKLVEKILSGVAPSAGTVCITFDDGYLDNLTVAAPVLDKLRLPATLFLATGYVERAEAQWSDTLYWLLTRRTSDKLSIAAAKLRATNLASAAEWAATRHLLHGRLLEASNDDREQLLSELLRQLAPAGTPPRLTMNWDEVRELRRRYPLFEIGGHTRDHVDLRRHRGETARAQIAGCVDDLRRELGVAPGHFSFPYARWCVESQQQVIELKWKSAVGMHKSLRIGPASDRFAMPRIEAPSTMTELRFKTSGAYPGALAALGLM